MTKCPRAGCGGQIYTDWDGRRSCLLCARVVGEPVWQVQPKPEHEPHWNKPLDTRIVSA